MPLPNVAERAHKSALWLGEEVLQGSVPIPNLMTLRQGSTTAITREKIT